MQHKVYYLHARTLLWHKAWLEVLFGVVLLLMVIIDPTASATRLQHRSLFIQNARPGVTTSHTVSFQYITPGLIGSVEMKYCVDPIPYMPCEIPPGLDVSQAQLSEQLGEQGFTILSKTQNKIVLSRTPTMIDTTSPLSSYKFDNIKNPTDTTRAFSIRLKTFTNAIGTGPQVDFGSVRSAVTGPIVLETQVPPMLMFCLAEEVALNCSETNDVYYSDMGELSGSSTLKAQSQMSVGTNASSGFVITAMGTPMASGTHVIKNMDTVAESLPGTDQFGINLVENSTPKVGLNPEGAFTNAVVADDYKNPNKYKFVSGDVVAYSPNVSLMRKYTVSYIVNTTPNLHAGVYTMTVNFIASGRF